MTLLLLPSPRTKRRVDSLYRQILVKVFNSVGSKGIRYNSCTVMVRFVFAAMEIRIGSLRTDAPVARVRSIQVVEGGRNHDAVWQIFMN
jgi:hypothetical protein